MKSIQPIKRTLRIKNIEYVKNIQATEPQKILLNTQKAFYHKKIIQGFRGN